MITLQSVDIMKEFSLPALKKLTKIFKEAYEDIRLLKHGEKNRGQRVPVTAILTET